MVHVELTTGPRKRQHQQKGKMMLCNGRKASSQGWPYVPIVAQLDLSLIKMHSTVDILSRFFIICERVCRCFEMSHPPQK